MSFLQRLKNRGVRSGQSSLQSESEETAVDKVAQLDVDVFQTENKIVIYAQSAGADMNDVNVSIEGDADIVLIEGRRIRPEYIVFPKRTEQGAYFASECVWGDFYRRIILPCMTPVFFSVALMLSHIAIKSFDLVMALTSGGPGTSSDVPAIFMYQFTFTRGQLGVGAAASMMMLMTVAAIAVPLMYAQTKSTSNT